VYPGRLEAEEEEKRAAHGIPFHPEVIDWFKSICGELSIPYILTDQ
jgi:LDH2 family malate/lactate/ureidoglycolate dehydrogenase